MAVKLTQTQSTAQVMRQDQTMTHQQIKALELLFAPVLELHKIVNEELEKNPILESEPDEAVPVEVPDNDEWLDRIIQLDEENRFIGTGNFRPVSPEEEERRQHYLESITVEQSLQESLIQQLGFLELDPRLLNCCEFIISGLDDDGFLSVHLADLAMAAGEPMSIVNQALTVVQGLEPVGVGARDLRERLLIQLSRQGKEQSLAYIAVRDHINDIAANHLPAIARKMRITIGHLKEILEQIQALNPRLEPGHVQPSEYVTEEVRVFEGENGLQVQMNNDNLPNLFISNQYRQLLNDPDTPKDVKDYVKEKIRAGVFMINSIIQRQTTIRKIVMAIVSVQEDFFKYGMDHLKPLIMAQVAKQVGVHETTVSRAVAGKYLRCKYGLLSLRQFFSTGYQANDGRLVSNTVVKQTIRQLIDEEDAAKPLSDSQIAKMLSEQGYTVVRRTVAKYRENMGILASNLRRQY